MILKVNCVERYTYYIKPSLLLWKRTIETKTVLILNIFKTIFPDTEILFIIIFQLVCFYHFISIIRFTNMTL